MKKLLALVCLLFIGCTHAVTSTKTDNPYLRPRTLNGPIDEIYEVAFRAAKRAFPEEDAIRKSDGRKVIIERDWFWRGDTIITVSVNEVGNNECIVAAESKANWHRLNPCPYGVAENELKYFGKALEEEYAEYKSPKPIDAKSRSLPEKLSELKQALDQGLISQEEYKAKKAEILKGY